ncbi:MAG: phosphatase PAP2 family protein [Nanoarchaeota archaeon]
MKKKIILFGLVIFSLLILGFCFDLEIIKAISFIRNNFLNEIFLKITMFGSAIVIFVFLTGLFLVKKKSRKMILPLWFSLGLSAFMVFLLKISIQRIRPFQTGVVSLLPVLEESSYFIWNFSFPSSHAMLSFCALPFLIREFPRFKFFWIFFVVLISFSRIYFGLHFLTDVIAGAVIGYLIGGFILKKEEENSFFEKILNKFRKN